MLLNGRAPQPGEIMTMPNLAKTFRLVAQHGKKVGIFSVTGVNRYISFIVK
jgi:gamma-glutamyltranspeptidase